MPSLVPARPGRVLLALVLFAAAALAFSSSAGAATIRIKPAKVTKRTLVFAIKDVRPSAIKAGRVVAGRRVQRLKLRQLRAAARRGRLNVPARRVVTRRTTARVEMKVSAKKKRPVASPTPTPTPTPTPEPTPTPTPEPTPTQTPEPTPTPDPEVEIVVTDPAAPAPAPSVPADALHVSPDGSDSNPGTASAPWRTIAKAVSTASAGQTVVLHPGTYAAYGTRTTFSRSGTATAPITFMGVPGAAKPVVLGAVKVTASHVRLRGLLFDGPTGPVLTPSSTNPLGEEVQIAVYGDGVEIADSEVRESLWHAGIYLDGADDVRITGNWIHHNGNFSRPEQANLDHGIYVGRGSGVIANNLIDSNLTHGVQIYPYGSNLTVKHNTIVNHGKAGVIIAREAANNVVTNNVVAYNRDNSIRSFDLSGLNNVVRRNLVWGNGSGNLGSVADGLTLIDNIQADPKFVSRGSNWRLAAGSPGIDAAWTSETVGVDLDGLQRPRGGAPDVGAYEVG